MGKVKYGENGKIIEETTIKKCTYPVKRYSKTLDLKVKLNIDSLLKIPVNQLDIGLNQTIIRLSDYTSEGLDMELFLFRICEMANNRGFTNEQTTSLIQSATSKWLLTEELKKKSNTSN